MDIIREQDVEKKQIESRYLQWLIADDGAVQSELCSCCIVEMNPGSTAKPPHSHANEEEVIFILEGRGAMITEGGKSNTVEKGSLIVMRRNEIHMLCNDSDEVMRAICFYSDKTDVSKYTFHPLESVGITEESNEK